MFKFVFKTAVLLFVILSVYLIVNPTACSNMLAGQERSQQTGEGTNGAPAKEENSTLSSSDPRVRSKDRGGDNADVSGIIDTNTLQLQSGQAAYSQEDIDYAIARRYVELEREYSLNHAMGKDTSREISFIVMDDFEMSPAEWDSFLSRANSSGLFERVRKEFPASASSPVRQK